MDIKVNKQNASVAFKDILYSLMFFEAQFVRPEKQGI